MTSLGRFFDFRMSPADEHRLDWFKTGASPIAQGAPVTRLSSQTAVDELDGRVILQLAGEGTARKVGESGLLVWEEPWPNVQLDRAPIERPSDYDTAPARRPVQVVYGVETQVVLRNISAEALAFEDQATYSGRNMVKPDDVADIELGSLLTPGAGNDDDGYYKLTNDATLAWLRVVDFEVVDANQFYLAAQVLF